MSDCHNRVVVTPRAEQTVAVTPPAEQSVVIAAPSGISASILRRLNALEAVATLTSGPNWIDLVSSFNAPPLLTASIASGDVWAYTYNGSSGGIVTYYRLVPSPYVATGDIFYTTFDGTILSGIVAERDIAVTD